ncbi:MAG: sulfotransferase domain-containing protein [Alphaproteobacteria bacterium]
MARQCLISTMPRSGAVYHRYLMATYDGLLRGGSGLTPPVIGGDFNGSIGADLDLAVCYSVFPGFRHEYQGPYRAVWDALEFKLPGYDWGSQKIDEQADRFWPSRNPDVRIVYIDRGQFAQMSSFWRHSRNHKNASLREAAAVGEAEFIRRFAIEGYLKQKFIWDEMAWRYPKQVMRFTYEGIMYERERSLRRMLSFFERAPDEKALAEAVRLTSAENLIAYEKETGQPLIPDQLGENASYFTELT